MTPAIMSESTISGAPPTVPGYVLHQVVGRGASSVVWTATSLTDGQRRAVKISPPASSDRDPMDVAAREQAILERVASEHIIRLHDAVPLDGGAVALVLDLADGGTLADLVAARGRLTPGECVTVLTPMASTLAGLHTAGVVHSDLAPGNVLFTTEGKPMLSDFDSARLVGESHPHSVSGTPGFVAPEVDRGALPTEASDVYGLGALAWHALSGTTVPPWSGPTGQPITLEQASGQLGPELAPVVVPLVSPDPGDRPSAAEAAVSFYGSATARPVMLARGGDPSSAMTRRIRAQAAAEVPAQSKGIWQSTPVRLAVILLAAAAFTALLLYLMSRQTQTPSVVAPTGSASAGPGPTGTATASGTPSGSAPSSLTPQAQLKADPQSVLQKLADARATALMSLDKDKLLLADVRDSPAYVTDAGLIDQMRSKQQTYANLVYHVRYAEWVSGEGPTAEVLATLDQAVYNVVGPGTATTSVAAKEGQPFTYTVTLVSDGWRISAIK